jgi:hypothetical protein
MALAPGIRVRVRCLGSLAVVLKSDVVGWVAVKWRE